MAYLLNQDDQDEQDLLQQAGQAPTTGPGAAASGGTVVTNPSSPNRFINFSSYFNANANAANSAGNNLVQGLDKNATQAQQQATTGAQDLTSRATTNTLQGPAPEASIQSVTAVPGQPNVGQMKSGGTLTRDQADAKSKETYQGPKTSDVEAYFNPVLANAQKSSREIATAQDAAGVKALQGGSGFDATLTRAAAGGRMDQLQKAYSGLPGAVQNSALGAWNSANTAETQSKNATDAYGRLVSEFDAGEKAKQERAADQAKTAAGWDKLWADSWGGKTPKSSTRAPGQRPRGAEWLASVDSLTGQTKYERGPLLAAVFDQLTDDEARELMTLSAGLKGDRKYAYMRPFVQRLGELTTKYGQQAAKTVGAQVGAR